MVTYWPNLTCNSFKNLKETNNLAYSAARSVEKKKIRAFDQVGGIGASLLFFLFFTMTYHGATVSPTLANFFYDQVSMLQNF
jgi:putative flippase GtrA